MDTQMDYQRFLYLLACATLLSSCAGTNWADAVGHMTVDQVSSTLGPPTSRYQLTSGASVACWVNRIYVAAFCGPGGPSYSVCRLRAFDRDEPVPPGANYVRYEVERMEFDEKGSLCNEKKESRMSIILGLAVLSADGNPRIGSPPLPDDCPPIPNVNSDFHPKISTVCGRTF